MTKIIDLLQKSVHLDEIAPIPTHETATYARGLMIRGLVAIGLGIVIANVATPKVASYLGWPYWLVLLLIVIDVFLVALIPLTYREYTANIALAMHRIPMARRSADYPPGCAYLLILTTVIIPVIALVWLIYVLVQ